jgi:hypothetical protein
VLVKSRRGGRRARRITTAQSEDAGNNSGPARRPRPRPSNVADTTTASSTAPIAAAAATDKGANPEPESVDPGSPGPAVGWKSAQPASASPSPDDGRRTSWNGGWQEASPEVVHQVRRQPSQGPDDIENHIASADLLNPSDALDLLAQVADRDAEGRGNPLQLSGPGSARPGHPRTADSSITCFPPIMDGFLTIANASQLLRQ